MPQACVACRSTGFNGSEEIDKVAMEGVHEEPHQPLFCYAFEPICYAESDADDAVHLANVEAR